MKLLSPRRRRRLNPALTRDNVIAAIEETAPSVHLYGCGSLGSHIAMNLVAYTGWGTIRLYDRDVVEEINLHTQAYDVFDIGMYKEAALAAAMKKRRPHLTILPVHVDLMARAIWAPFNTGIHIVALDSFEARREVFTHIRENAFDIFYIDPAVSATSYTVKCGGLRADIGNDVYTWNEAMITNYLTSLAHEEEEGQARGCNVGGTVNHTSAVCAAAVMECIVRWILGEPVVSWQHVDLRTATAMHGLTLGLHDQFATIKEIGKLRKHRAVSV